MQTSQEGNRRKTREYYSDEIEKIIRRCSPEQFRLLDTERKRYFFGKEVIALSETVLCFLINYGGMPALKDARESMIQEYRQAYEEFLARQEGK